MDWDPIVEEGMAPVHPDVAELLRKRLTDLREGFRQNIALLGPPGSGKSSTILAALTAASATQAPLLTVYCQVRREPWELWARRFLTATLHGLVGFRPAMTISPDESRLLRAAYTTAPRTAQTIAELLPQIRATPHERVFRQILDLPYLAADETKRPGVIVLDEFHELEHLGVHRPFHELGKRIMLERSMIYVLASSSPMAARRILRERLNLLFGGFEIVDLGCMEYAASEALILQRLSARHVLPPVQQFLQWFTDGHAWLLDTLLAALATLGGSGDLNADELLQRLAETLADVRQPLARSCADSLQCVDEGRAGRAYLAILTALAQHRGTPRALAGAVHQTVAETSRQLGRLLEQGLVERHGEIYTLRSPLWGFWFRQVYTVRRAATVPTRDGLIAWARQRLDDEWRLFQEDICAPPLERFLHLLQSFQDELVRVESRRLRLPAFARLQQETIGPGVYQITAEPSSGAPWLYFVKEVHMEETDITTFLQRTGRLRQRHAQRVVVSLDGFDAAAQLLAKVSKCWVWYRPTLQALYRIYRWPALKDHP